MVVLENLDGGSDRILGMPVRDRASPCTAARWPEEAR
jgi:hypothetical protein